jgi:hypothetical protein
MGCEYKSRKNIILKSLHSERIGNESELHGPLLASPGSQLLDLAGRISSMSYFNRRVNGVGEIPRSGSSVETCILAGCSFYPPSGHTAHEVRLFLRREARLCRPRKAQPVGSLFAEDGGRSPKRAQNDDGEYAALAAEEHISAGQDLKTGEPETTVRTICKSLILSWAMVKGSSERTTKSANLPGVMEPLMASSCEL